MVESAVRWRLLRVAGFLVGLVLSQRPSNPFGQQDTTLTPVLSSTWRVWTCVESLGLQRIDQAFGLTHALRLSHQLKHMIRSSKVLSLRTTDLRFVPSVSNVSSICALESAALQARHHTSEGFWPCLALFNRRFLRRESYVGCECISG